jgi:hypothetical protein
MEVTYIAPEKATKLQISDDEKRLKKKIDALKDYIRTIEQNESKSFLDYEYRSRLKARIRKILALSEFLDIPVGKEFERILKISKIIDKRQKQEIKICPRHNVTKRAKKRGKKLQVKDFNNDLYLVSGGENQHIVWYQDDEHCVCDCNGWDQSKAGICSHVYAVILLIEEKITF